MPALANPRHEAFCQARATGRTLEQAYADAGYKPHVQNAERMMRNDGIKARLAELQAITVQRFEITTEMIARDLDEAFAMAKQLKQPGAMVAASTAKGKLAGLFVERQQVNVSHSYSLMTEEELRFELAALNAEARLIKAGEN